MNPAQNLINAEHYFLNISSKYRYKYGEYGMEGMQHFGTYNKGGILSSSKALLSPPMPSCEKGPFPPHLRFPSPRCQNTTLQLLTLRGRREEGRRKGGFSGRSQFFFQAEAPKKVNSAAHAFISPHFFGAFFFYTSRFFPPGGK